MSKFLIIAFLLAKIGTTLNAQEYYEYISDTLNRFDDKGKKNGYRIEFLDKNLNSVQDTNKAMFFCHVIYSSGIRNYPPRRKSNCNLQIKNNEASKSENNKIVVLDGQYTFYKRNKIYDEYYFKKGMLYWIKTYYRNGEINEFIDYSQFVEGQTNTCRVIVYNKDGTIISDNYFKKEDNLWKLMKK